MTWTVEDFGKYEAFKWEDDRLTAHGYPPSMGTLQERLQKLQTDLGFKGTELGGGADGLMGRKTLAYLYSDPKPAPPIVAVPAKIIDLTNAKVTLPVQRSDDDVRPLEIKRPLLDNYRHEKYFYGSDGRVIFCAPTDGAHTENSYYSRSEVREMRNNGVDLAAWDSWRGKNIMNLRQAILEVPDGKPEVVAGQCHDAHDDVAMCRLEGEDLFIESRGQKVCQLDMAYKLGRMFDLSLIFTETGLAVAYHNLVTNLRVSRLVLEGQRFSGCYWKFGVYTQASSLVPKSDKRYGIGRGKVAVDDATLLHAA